MEKTIVLDSTIDESKKNDTLDLDSTNDEQNGHEDEHFITASNTQFMESPTKVTSTPNVPPIQTRSMLFQEVEDEFAHDDSFSEAVSKTTSILKEDSDATSNKTPPVETQRQISPEE